MKTFGDESRRSRRKWSRTPDSGLLNAIFARDERAHHAVVVHEHISTLTHQRLRGETQRRLVARGVYLGCPDRARDRDLRAFRATCEPNVADPLPRRLAAGVAS